MSFPLKDVFRYINTRKADEVLTQAVLQAPIFGLRWRWDASRALAVLRFSGGRKVPPPLQRMRSDDLLAAAFPEQVACQDNAPPGDIEVPDHPLVFETMRDCTTEAMDLDGFKRVLGDIDRGEIEVFARDTTQPSVFSHQILNAVPYAFLDDAPLEERRSRAVALRRALPEDARDLGALDATAVESAARDAWPVVRDADELHDALLTLGMLPVEDVGRGAVSIDVDRWSEWSQALVREGRVVRGSYGEGRVAWVATERVPLVEAAFPDVRFDRMPQTLAAQGDPPAKEEAELTLVRGRVESMGPFTAAGLAQALGMGCGDVNIALAHLEATGNILRGQFTPGVDEEEFCDRRILARIHRDTVARLRREIEPASAATFMRFLFRWQHFTPARQLQHEGGLLEVVEQLQGFEAAAVSWESEILPSRVSGYRSDMLDDVCLTGEAVWGRFSRRASNGDVRTSSAALSRNVPISLGLREDLPWLLSEPTPDGNEAAGAAGEVLGFLSRHGASFLADISAGTRRLQSDVEKILWQLAAAGLVTTDGFGALRGVVDDAARRARQSSRSRRRPRRRLSGSRWSLLQSGTAQAWPDGARPDSPRADEAPTTIGPSEEDVMGARAGQILQRYGIVFPELLAHDSLAPRWRDLLRVYRRAEARGEIRGGRFVVGFVGEQFALPEAVETLRSVRKASPDGQLLRVSACDPLNLTGAVTPGPRVPAQPGNRVVFRDGVPVASVQGGEVHLHADMEDETRPEVLGLLAASQGASHASSPSRVGLREAGTVKTARPGTV